MSRCKLEEFISYEQPAKYIVDSDQYDDSYETPVLTAGKSFILGYTDEKNNIFDNLPVIIFDDFTTSVQFVDFPFKVKSSAMKLLKNTEQADIKYCYYLLKFLQHTPENHKRQWLSATSQNIVELPTIEKQKNIVMKLDKILEVIDNQNKQLELLDEAIKARFVEMFGDPITNDKHLRLQSLFDLSILKAGKSIKTGELFEAYDDEILMYPCFGGNGIRGYINRYSHDGEYPVIGRQGAWAGNVNYATGKFYATEHAIVVTPKVELNTVWYYYGLKYLDLTRFQTGAAQPGLAVDKLNKVVIPFPSIELQNQFASFVEEIDKSRLLSNHSLFLTKSIIF